MGFTILVDFGSTFTKATVVDCINNALRIRLGLLLQLVQMHRLGYVNVLMLYSRLSVLRNYDHPKR